LTTCRAEQAGRKLGDLDLQVACHVAIGDNAEQLVAHRKPAVAFSLGAMGSATTNFYNDAFRRAGYDDDARAVQELWLDGRRDAAIARVPDELVTRFSAVGTATMVAERFREFRRAGVTCLHVRFECTPEAEKHVLLEQTCDLVASTG
jgi:alkanesulfonate monooxygenase SsuD/methylene tetrahydromethanopterin reductase-like flavin-dependent oxidoreductase (luciferase family)